MSLSLPQLKQISSNLSPKQKLLIAKLLELDGASGPGEPIAITGMGCRFPGESSTPERYWDLLERGETGIVEIGEDRWSEDLFDPDWQTPGKLATRWAGLVSDLDQFDPTFFKITGDEAKFMDPRQRQLLETSWEAFEQGGYTRKSLLNSNTGVFVGAHSDDYYYLELNDIKDYGSNTFTGHQRSIMANRISYIFDLWGPSVCLDTACSSSLVTIHLAVKGLRNGECDLALAGGTNLVLSPLITMQLSKLNMMAPDGQCKTFDHRANGYVRGEGTGMVLLKRLKDARRDGDKIYAVIRGSAVNQDGKTSGITAPKGLSQEDCIRRAMKDGGVQPGDMDYIECHGTGTALGDPIEVGALAETYGDRENDDPCFLGAVKTNIGHLETAAGVAGLMKVALSLHNEKIPVNRNFEKINPEIDLDDTTFVLASENADGTPWPRNDRTRVASVSSFGFGGTNSHIILAEGPLDERQPTQDRGVPETLLISGHTEETLRGQALAYQEYLGATDANLPDIAATLAKRRSHHEYRVAVAGNTREELAAGLGAYLDGVKHPGLVPARRQIDGPANLGLVFSGQGPQWWGMGRQLYEKAPVFRAKIDEIDALLKQHADWSLVEELTGRDENTTRLGETEIAQPAIFALQVALTELWREWGVIPAEWGGTKIGVVGHSVGEVAAAHVAGVLTLEDAVRVIYHRARFMQAATGLGKMAAVEAPAEEIADYVSNYGDKVAIGAYNAPGSCVLSGEEAALDELLAKLEARKIRVKKLRVNYAFHSPQMEPFKQKLTDELKGLKTHAPHPDVMLYSTLTGQQAVEGDFGAEYWGRNIREAVYFAPAVKAMTAGEYTKFNAYLEISPHPVLANYLQTILEASDLQDAGLEYGVATSLKRETDELINMRANLGALYTMGVGEKTGEASYLGEIERAFADAYMPVELPRYAWQTKSYWLDKPRGQLQLGGAEDVATDIPGRRLRMPGQIAFETKFSVEEPFFLKDHILFDEIVVAGATYTALVIGAANKALGPHGPVELSNILYKEALVLTEGAPRFIQTHLIPEGDGHRFRVLSLGVDEGEGGEWVLHAEGDLSIGSEPLAGSGFSAEVATRIGPRIDGADWYKNFKEMGYQHRESYHWIKEAWRKDGEAVAKLGRPASSADEDEALLFAPLIDALFQLTTSAIPGKQADGSLKDYMENGEYLYVPFGVASLRSMITGPVPEDFWCHVTCTEGGPDNFELFAGDLAMYDAQGNLLVEVKNWSLKRVARSALLSSIRRGGDWVYEMAWKSSASRRSVRTEKGAWLVVAGKDEVSKQVSAQLEAAGATCVILQAGDSFAKAGDKHYTVNPGSREDFEQVLDQAYGEDAPRGIIHLWGLDARDPEAFDEQVLAGENHTVTGSVLHLAQALTAMSVNKRGWDNLPATWIATQGAYAVGGANEATRPTAAALWGIGRIIALETPEAFGGLVDLDPVGATEDPARVAGQLLGEILHNEENENHIAYRKGKRYVGELSRVKGGESQEVQLDGSATYLITGGLGGLGLKTAAYLAGRGAGHVVLTGRSDRSADVKFEIEKIEKAGAKVHVITGDISQSADVTRIIAEAEKIGPLKGVLHAAGVLEDGVLAQQDWARFERVLAPKVQGTWNLHAATRDKDLDHFVLFSSIASMTGSPGQANYASGNAFMDSLAQYRKSLGLSGLSINWGPWEEVGMAAKLEGGGEAGDKGWNTVGMIPVDAGMKLMGELMTGRRAQVGVIPFKWARLFERFPAMEGLSLFRALIQSLPARVAETGGGLRKDLAEAAAETRMSLLTNFVKTEMAKVIGLPPDGHLNPKKGFFELGGDSLSSIELRNRLQLAVEMPLPSTLIFDYPSIETITEFLAGELLGDTEDAAAPAEAPAKSVEDEAEMKARIGAEVDELSEADAEAELLKELAALED